LRPLGIYRSVEMAGDRPAAESLDAMKFLQCLITSSKYALDLASSTLAKPVAKASCVS